MKKIYLIFFVLFFSPFFGEGSTIVRNQKIDSLLTSLNKAKTDTNKVDLLNKLSREYINISEYDRGLKYANKALALSSSLTIENKRGWSKGIANAFNMIGIIYYHQNNYPEALRKQFASLKISEELGNKKDIAASYYCLGLIYQSQGNYPAALKNHFAALKIWEVMKDKKGMAQNYNSIGNIYWNQANYPEALKYFLNSLRIWDELADKPRKAITYKNIGNVYYNQKNYSDALKNYNVSLDLYQELKNISGIADINHDIGAIYENQGNHRAALNNFIASQKVYKEINDINGIASCYNNIGAVYYSLGNYPEALKNFYASIKIQEDIGDKQGLASSFFNLGGFQAKLKKFKEAREYLNMALQVYNEINSKAGIKNSYHSLSLLDSMEGNWKTAYQHHKLFVIYQDSIDNEETKKKTIESALTYKFETQKAATKAEQDKKDAIAEANKKRQQIVLLLVTCVLLLVIVFSVFVIRSLRITRKQKNIIELQKNEVFHQKEMVSEKNKEITDSINYAQRIQRALLASDKMLNENFNSNSTSSPLSNWREGRAEVNYFIFFQPKDIVSGDFYWASPLANGNFAITTADSTGHGVPGAIMSMLNISCLNEAANGQQLTAPNEILNYTRSKIIEHLSNDGSADGGKDGMDCSLLSFEFNPMIVPPSPKEIASSSLLHSEKGVFLKERMRQEGPGLRLTYSAANNPIWIVRQKQIIELEPDKMPVGKHEKDKISFTQHNIELLKGDTVYTITDGFADQFGGPKGKKFMAKQLKKFLISICHLTMNDQKERLTAEFNSWKGNLEQVDDVTIIGIRI